MSAPPARVVPRCRHFGPCGGCQHQDVAYHQQLDAKRAALTALLSAALGSRCPPVEPMRPTPFEGDAPWAFRQKATFVFAELDGRLEVGHYAAGSRRVVAIRECPVHSARANRLAFAFRDALARARVGAVGGRRDGILRHLLVRSSLDDQQAVAMLVVTRNAKALRAPIRAVLDGPDAPTGFHLNVHDRDDPFVIGRETRHLAGRTQVLERHLGPGFLISPTAFFQTNVEATVMLRAEVMAAVAGAGPGTGRVLDLYAGSGLFALSLSMEGWRVTAVEENSAATRDAQANATFNRLPPGRLQTITARVEDVLGRPTGEPVDVAIIDPPRQGCPPAVLDALFGRLAPPRVVYVSCNPQALARELPRAVGLGYEILRVQPVDMFPHTDHIETVVTLVKTEGRDRGREERGGRRRQDTRSRRR